MPMSASPNPLSTGQFGADAYQSGGQMAAGAGTGLAQAIIGNPQMQAQAGLIGAETGASQAATQRANHLQAVGQDITGSLQDAMTSGNPASSQRALALAAQTPEIAAQLPRLLSTMMQSQAASGQGGVNQAAADRFSAGTGIAAAGNTFSGQALDLATSRANAGTAAGATLGAARIGANASMSNTAAVIAGENARTLVPVKGADGSISYEPAVQAGKSGAGFYDPSSAASIANTAAVIAGENARSAVQVGDGQGGAKFMNTIQAQNTGAPAYDPNVGATERRPVTILGPNGPRIVPTVTAEQTGAMPSPTSTEEVKAQALSSVLNPPPDGKGVLANPPPAGNTDASGMPATPSFGNNPRTVGGDNNSGVAGGLTSDERQLMRTNMLAGLTNPSGQSSAQQSQATQNALTLGAQKLYPAYTGSNSPDPETMGLLTQQEAYLERHGPTAGNQGASVQQALSNVFGQSGGNIARNYNVLGATPSTTHPLDRSQVIAPPGFHLPTGYGAQQPAPSLNGTMAAPAAPPAAPPGPATPAAAAPAGPAATNPAAQRYYAQAQQALDSGKDPAAVAAMLSRLGLAPMPAQTR